MIVPSSPLFVHSDIGLGFLALKRSGATFNPRNIQKSLFDFLSSLSGKANSGLLFPSFNYNYGQNRIFDVNNDSVQVGALPEWVRNNMNFERSYIPFFSFLSDINLNLPLENEINPFGSKSGFQWLVDNDSTLMLFGTSLNRLTFIHYVEEISGSPLYRYIKHFPGKIIKGKDTFLCNVIMHVRPKGVHLDYDWLKLENDLFEVGIMKKANYSKNVIILNAKLLLDFWLEKIYKDPFYLIDLKSRQHFEVATNYGETRVMLEQYE